MLSYTRYPDLDFTYFVSEGETTIENWFKTVLRYARDGMTTRELYDLRQQTNIFTNDEVGMILHQTLKDQALRPPNGKTAVIVDKAIKYGLSRMYALYAEVEDVSSTTEVFYKLDDAFDWLGDDVADRMPELRLGLAKVYSNVISEQSIADKR
jgi:hypothetical protein